MKTKYKGYEISVTREESLGGDELLYYSIFREVDGYECTSSFSTGIETVREFINILRGRIDEEEKSLDPWNEMDYLLGFDFIP